MEIDDMWDDEEDVAPFIKKVANPKPPIDSMSLRDWFAGQVLAGDNANAEGGVFRNDALDVALLSRAKLYYRIADAMLEARALK